MNKNINIPFPQKQYCVIYADPPWAYDNHASRAAAASHYETMTQEDIAALPVPEIAAKDCALFLWATFPMLKQALEIIEAWGFHYKTCAFTWIKQNPRGDELFMGIGNWTRSNAEVCLLATRGKPKRVCKKVRSVIVSHIEQHSKKPDETRRRIDELMGDVPRIELFARTRAIGWDSWGNEVLDEGFCNDARVSAKQNDPAATMGQGDVNSNIAP